MKRFFIATTFILGLAVLGTRPIGVFAQDEAKVESQANEDEKTAGSDEKEKPKTVEAKLKPLAVYELFDGTFEASRTHEIKTDFDAWSDLVIKSVVEEGTVVSKDQPVLELDTKSLKKAVREAQFAVQMAEFDMAHAKLELKEVEATFDLENQIAEREWKNAQEDHQYYEEVELPHQLDDLDYQEKTAGYYLEYSRDELDQLEKMYTEDELTEESEEIVLKRARRAVESAERSRDRTMRQVKRQRETEIPRDKLKKNDDLEREKLEFDRSSVILPIKKAKAEIALGQAEFEWQNKTEKLKELNSDLQQMTLKSPADGVLYYGKSQRGKWVGPTGASGRRLEPDKKVANHAVVMTIVEVGQLVIRAELEEEMIDTIRPRMRGRALIKSAGDKVIPVMVKTVSRVPLDNGKFDCEIIAEGLAIDDSVMPGMSCQLSFLSYENDNSIVVSKDSVFSDDGEISHYVYVVDEDGEPKRKSVSVGHTSGDDLEIVDGLAAGDQIAKEKP